MVNEKGYKEIEHMMYVVLAVSIAVAFILIALLVVIITKPNSNQMVSKTKMNESIMSEYNASTMEISTVEFYNTVEYEEEILPDGLYLYSVDGAYMTVGIMTTGCDETGAKAGHIQFYATASYGEQVSTYETIFIQQSANPNIFDCIGGKYELEYTDAGLLNVKSLVDYDDLGTELGFEGEYIFAYWFGDSTVKEE